MDVSTGVIERHRAAGRFFTADGVRSFVREEGAWRIVHRQADSQLTRAAPQ